MLSGQGGKKGLLLGPEVLVLSQLGMEEVSVPFVTSLPPACLTQIPGIGSQRLLQCNGSVAISSPPFEDGGACCHKNMASGLEQRASAS